MTLYLVTKKCFLWAAFVQPLEGFVTIGYVLTSTDFGLCEIYRSFLLRAVRGVSSASLTLMQTVLAYEKSEEDRATLRSQVLLETSVLHAKCKHVRLLPVSNSSAVIREVLQTAVVCKDMVKEFTELVETAAGGEGGAELPEGRSEEEVEIGSDEWYALMDSLAGDNACTAEEATTIKEEVKIVNAVYSLLRCVSNMIKLTDDSSDREEQQRYRSWLEETIRLDRVLKDNLTDLGVLLNPPHDSSLQEKAVSVKKQALALAMHIHKHTVNESRRQHTCFQRFEEFVHALD